MRFIAKFYATETTKCLFIVGQITSISSVFLSDLKLWEHLSHLISDIWKTDTKAARTSIFLTNNEF